METDWAPWHFAWDFNTDGAITISDVGLWLKWLFFLPGDTTAYFLVGTALGNFMELGAQSYGSVGSGVLSAFAWFIGYVFLLATFND